ncbi:MAG: hypothetical protein HYV96_05360 [Opitutae bacterium]|nr:hypothetical protein [Opitutae bacterium]
MQIHLKYSSDWRRRLSPSDTRWWLLRAIGFRIEIQRDPIWDFVIYWKRLLVALAVLAFAGYLTGVTALHYWWGRQGESEMGWSDIALAPLHWAKFRQQRGDRMIALGQAKQEKGRFAEAAFDLQAGLARSPRNLEGRLALAQVWSVLDRPRALKVVEDGLVLSPSEPELLGALFDLYLIMGADTKALERSAALLTPDRRPALSPDARRVVANSRAMLLLMPHPAEALDLLTALPRETTSREGLRSVQLTLRALHKLGRDLDATALLAQVPRDGKREPRLDLELAVAAGDVAALETALRRLRVATENPVQTSLLAIRAWHELKRSTLRDAAIVEFLRFHGADERALQGLGALAVELDLPLVLVRAEQEAEKRRFNPFAFQVHETELALRRGDLDEARRRLPRWENTLPELPDQQREIPELFARVVRAAGPNGEAQEAALLAHLTRAGPRLKPAVFQLAIDTLERGGNTGSAAQVAGIAVRFLPLSDAMRAEQTRLADRVAEKKIADARMGSAKASPTPVMARDEAEALEFPSGAATLTAVDEALVLHESGRALRVIRAVRKSAPEWLAEVEPTLATREFRARRAQGEMPSAMIVFRTLALKPGLARAAAFRLVRELIAEGDGEQALQLAREIVRLVPGERAAAVLLKEAEAAAPVPVMPAEKSEADGEAGAGKK